MKKLMLFLLLTSLIASTFAQVQEPVKWSFSTKKLNATTYEVHLKANIEQGWHIYSQNTPEGGPVPTEISFVLNPLLKLNGPAREVGKLEQHFEKLFGVNVNQFSDKVTFVQTITVKNGVKTNVNGSVQFMVCNDHECIPPTRKKFSLALN